MKGDAKCPFCRVPSPKSDEEIVERVKKRVEMDDAVAIYCQGCGYYNGLHGFHRTMKRHLNFGIGQENLVMPQHITILAVLMIKAMVWKGI